MTLAMLSQAGLGLVWCVRANRQGAPVWAVVGNQAGTACVLNLV